MTKYRLQKQMLTEMIDKDIFNQVKAYAFDYADNSLERNVYPTKEGCHSFCFIFCKSKKTN